MAKRKYLVKKLHIKCFPCRGKGRKEVDAGHSVPGVSAFEECKSCKGMGFIPITPKDEIWEREYEKYIKLMVDTYTDRYRQAREIAGNMGDELSKYCKEYDKILNKWKKKK